MDRDVYLILIGAGISLASSVITLLFQFFLDLVRENRRRKQVEKEAIRFQLTQKDAPYVIGGRWKPDSTSLGKFTLSPYLRYKYFRLLGFPFLINPRVFRLSALVGISIFICWVIWVLFLK